MSTQRTLDQMRAADALEKIRQIAGPGNEVAGSYLRYIERLPATVVMNGLGQAAAMLLSNAGSDKPEQKAYSRLYGHLEAWLCRDSETAPYQGAEGLIEAVTTGDQDAYVRAQAEALAWLGWAKKFARAYLDKPEGGRPR